VKVHGFSIKRKDSLKVGRSVPNDTPAPTARILEIDTSCLRKCEVVNYKPYTSIPVPGLPQRSPELNTALQPLSIGSNHRLSPWNCISKVAKGLSPFSEHQAIEGRGRLHSVRQDTRNDTRLCCEVQCWAHCGETQ
jgi:hypothetical protein